MLEHNQDFHNTFESKLPLASTERLDTQSVQIIRTKQIVAVGQEPDPTALPAHEAFRQLVEFNQRLKAEYPDRDWMRRSFITLFNPETSWESRYFLAKIGQAVVGAVLGSSRDGSRFSLDMLQVDPKYQGKNVGADLLGALKTDYQEISILAAPYGFDRQGTDERDEFRQRALFRFYERHGFIHSVEDDPAFMEWHRS